LQRGRGLNITWVEMERRRLTALAIALAFVVAALSCASAQAAPVLVMGRDGHVTRENDRFITATDSITPTGISATAAGWTAAARSAPQAGVDAPAEAGALRAGDVIGATQRKKPTAPAVTVPTVLAKLLARQQITAAEHATYLGDWNRAITEEKHLSKPRAAQMDPVTEMMHDMAVAGTMTAGRLPVLFLTLEHNAQWWRSGPMLSYGQRVEFAGSELEWEYYTGEGIQLQVLGTFGEANGFYEAGKASWPNLITVMNEMIPLAVMRGGGLAWEYYFDWEGSPPPWISAMAQATGLEALSGAYLASGNAMYLSTAHAALGILETPPPTGVAVTTSLGKMFLQYNFEPRTDIINAFLQTLIGLYDYGKVSGDQTAETLFNEGNAQAQAALPAFNTGAWSLYEPGEADDLNYHELVTTFLQNLCTLTGTPVYCSTYTDFNGDLSTPPVITQVTMHAVKHTGFRLYFTLDKPAHVGVIVTNAAGQDVLYTSASCQPGTDYWTAPKLSAGAYTVRLSGTDLAGNYATVSGTLTVS
jgi:hypothetical protein